MTSAAQITHISLKDLRGLRPGAIGLATVVILSATLTAFGVSLITTDGAATIYVYELLRSAVIQGLSALFVLALIRLDHPGSPVEHWVGTPLSPAAIFGSKLLTATVVIVLVQATAQSALLAAKGISPFESSLFVFVGALSALQTVLASAIIASLFRSVASCVAALVLYAAACLALGSLLVERGFERDATSTFSILASGLELTIQALALGAMYRHRLNPGRSRLLAAAAFLMVALAWPLATWAFGRIDISGETATPLSPAGSTTRFETDSLGIAVILTVPAPPPGVRYAVVNPVLKLTSEAGQSIPAYHMFSGGSSVLNGGPTRSGVVLLSESSEFQHNIDFRNDSMIVRLRYMVADSLAAMLPGTTASFDVILERQLSTVLLDRALGAHDRSILVPHVEMAAAGDTAAQLRLSATILGPVENSSVSFLAPQRTFQSESDAWVARHGYLATTGESTYQLRRTSPLDTLPLVSTAPEISETHLAIPWTTLHSVVVGFRQNAFLPRADINEWKHSRLVIKHWTYAGHQLLHATARVQ